MTELDRAKINEIIKTYIRESLEFDENYRIDHEDGVTDGQIEKMVKAIDIMIDEERKDLAKGDYEMASRTVDHILKAKGLKVVEGSHDYKLLCREVLKAKKTIWNVQKARTTGDYSSPEEEALKPILDPTHWSVSNQGGVAGTAEEPKQTSATMKEAGEEFWNEYHRGWNARSQTDYRNAIDQVVAGLGPRTQIHTVDYQRAKEFRDALRKGTISKNNKPLSIKRVNFLVSALKRIYAHALKQDKGLDRINPAEDLQLKDRRKASEKRDTFTTEDLKTLFIDSKEYGQDKHNKAPNFWLPLLGLYTGARMEELCQLLIEDVVQRDGLWCIDIREDNAKRKSVKTGERRIVPLHPFIVEDLRFPEFVQSIDPSRKRVFHELKYINNRWGHGFGQWFGLFKKRAGIDAPKGMKSFHSFRHTLINHLKQNEAEQQYVKEFVGHQTGKDITWGLYGKSFKPAILMDKVVSKLNYPVDLGHLKDSKWVPKGGA